MIEVVKKHIEIGIGLEALPLVEEEPPNKNNSQSNYNVDANEFPSEGVNHNRSSSNRWTKMEISNLIQLRTSFEQRYPSHVTKNNFLWAT